MDNLIKYKETRMWKQMCDILPECMNEQTKNEMKSLFLENIQQYHPISIMKCCSAMCKHYDCDTAISLLTCCITSIQETNMYSGDFTMQVMYLEIYKSIYCIKKNELQNAEKIIFEYKNIEMSVQVYNLYTYMTYLYYECIHDYDHAVKHLLSYIKNTGDKTNIDNNDDMYTKLVQYSLLSETFYNFAEIRALKEFSSVDETLKMIFIAVMDGNTLWLQNNRNVIDEMFSDKTYSLIKKAYYVGLINLCFMKHNTVVSFAEIHEQLNVPVDDIHTFLLHALGLKLITGWIDGLQNVLHFSTVLPRSLPKEELSNMMTKYEKWNNRIEHINIHINK